MAHPQSGQVIGNRRRIGKPKLVARELQAVGRPDVGPLKQPGAHGLRDCIDNLGRRRSDRGDGRGGCHRAGGPFS